MKIVVVVFAFAVAASAALGPEAGRTVEAGCALCHHNESQDSLISCRNH